MAVNPNYTTNEWTDSLGNKIKIGDVVAIATINGRSPQMVFVKITRLNTHRSNGDPIFKEAEFVDTEVGSKEERDVMKNPYASLWNTHDNWQGKKISSWKIEGVPAVTVTGRAIKDGRGFFRWAERENTYQFIGNVVKVDFPEEA